MESLPDHNSPEISPARLVPIQPLHHRQKLYLFIAAAIAAIALLIGLTYILITKSSLQHIRISTTATKRFNDNELGISFQYPRSWGDASANNDFSSTQILREIAFANQPHVKLVSMTEHRLYPAEFEREAIATDADIEKFCQSQRDYLVSHDLEPSTTDGEDVFRQNGVYNFGNCAIEPPFVNTAQKITPLDPQSTGLGLDNPYTITSDIRLGRSFFWQLTGPAYRPLTLQVDVPDIASEGFCTRLSYAADDTKLTKNFTCINHAEREVIEAAFDDFNATQLAQEVAALVESLQIYPADPVIYPDYFTQMSVFRDETLGIQFRYPSVFGAPVYDTARSAIRFPQDDNNVMYIMVNTPAEVARTEAAAADCAAGLTEDVLCYPPYITQSRWEQEGKRLDQETTGQVSCLFGAQHCAVGQVGQNRMLIRYINQWPMTDGVRKEYIFYGNGRRFDVLIGSAGLYTQDLAEFRAKEADNFTHALVEEIVRNIRLTETE